MMQLTEEYTEMSIISFTMTSFASRDNINLIWQVITTFPLFHTLYPSEESKLKWFNKVIRRFQKTFIESISDLHVVNRGVITTMIDDLHKHALLEKTKSYSERGIFPDVIDEPIKNMSELIQKHMDVI